MRALYKETVADIVTFMNRFRKEDAIDPTHKWIGTYNTNLIHVTKFFKWMYSPNVDARERKKPPVVENFRRLKRLEISGYKPSDMWTPQENLLFLKYCPSARDRCYHSMETDLGARAHELLKLRIKDVEFIQEGDSGRYARVVLNGKTGERVLPLIDSIPYVTQWISNHPQGGNREAILLPDKAGNAIQVGTMLKVYNNYKRYFAGLLDRQDIPEEDKKWKWNTS
jgi:integrase